MDEHIYPAESVYHAEVEANRAAGKPWQPTNDHGGAQGQGPRRRSVEPVSCPSPSTAPA